MISQGFSPHLSNSTFFFLSDKKIDPISTRLRFCSVLLCLTPSCWRTLFYSLLFLSGIFILYLSIASLFLPKNWMTSFHSKGTFLYPVSLHFSFTFTGAFLDRLVYLIYFSLKLSTLASVSSTLLKLFLHNSQVTFRFISLDSQHFHHHSIHFFFDCFLSFPLY